MWTSFERGKSVPKLVQFWDSFLTGFGSQNGPQNYHTNCKGINNVGVHLWIPFIKALVLFGCVLGAFLGFLKLVWEASGLQKP